VDFAVGFGGGLGKAAFVDIGGVDLGAFCREQQRGGAADARCSTA
jgi:hypothetical protein